LRQEVETVPASFRVGFAGHRWNLMDRSRELRLRERLGRAMSEIGTAVQGDIELVVGQADGADMMAADMRPSGWRLQIVLPEGGTSPDYEGQAVAILAQAKMLLVVWNGLPGRGAGGTADTVRKALTLGMTVLWLDSTLAVAGMRQVTALTDTGPVSKPAGLSELSDIVANVLTPRANP
jgi:hypothetical protein